jgi:hypothetical protein
LNTAIGYYPLLTAQRVELQANRERDISAIRGEFEQRLWAAKLPTPTFHRNVVCRFTLKSPTFFISTRTGCRAMLLLDFDARSIEAAYRAFRNTLKGRCITRRSDA